MRTRWFKRAMTGLAFAAATVMAVPMNALACTQVWMPDQFTAEENTWYAGRAEDTAARAVKIFGFEPRHDAGFVYQSNENGDGPKGDNFQWTSPIATYRYTYVRDHGDNDWEGYDNAYSAAGINEWGVSCSATLSIYYNDAAEAADPTVDEGIGEYNYVSIALGQSKTARDAVKLLGSIIDDKGACSTDQIIISDNTESWMLSVVSGHQWVAFQLPEDQASANPNMGSLWYKLNLDDEEECIHSEKLVSLPTEKGFLKEFEDGIPDIARTYADPDSEGPGQYSRYVIGRAYFGALDGLNYKVDDYTDRYGTEHKNYITSVDDAPLFFTPGRSDWTTFDMIRSLAARADNVTGLKDGVSMDVTGVGRQDSLESHIFEIKRNTDPQVGTVEWLALNRDEYSVAIPSFGALVTKVNDRFGTQQLDLTHQGKAYWEDSVDTAMEAGDWDQYLPYVMMDLNTLANANRTDLAPTLRAYEDALQNALIADNDTVEAELRKIDASDTKAREALATKAADEAAEVTWERCYKVLTEAREWLKGDKSKPFAPSDYDAEKKSLVTPLDYAERTLGTEPENPTAGWVEDENGKKYVDEDGNPVTSQWVEVDGDRFHVDENGYMETGWVTDEDGQRYWLRVEDNDYGPQGTPGTGWLTDEDGQRFFLRRNDNAYGPQGSMGSGWLYEDGQAYFLRRADNEYGPKGSVGSGWLTENGQTYFLRRSDNEFGKKGTIGTGWLYEGGQAYFLRRADNQWGSRGTLGTGWLTDGGHTYFLRRADNQWGPKGTAARGWMTENGHRFYFDWKTGRLS